MSTTPDLLDELAELTGHHTEPATAVHAERHLVIETETDGQASNLYVLDLVGALAIQSGGVELTPEQARQVAQYITQWANR